MTIRTQKPNLLRLWLRHIKTGSFQRSFSRIFIFAKNIGRKIILFCHRLKAKKIIGVFNFKPKKIKPKAPLWGKSSKKIANIIKAEGLSLGPVQEKKSFINNFVLRHIGLFIIAAIVFVSNFLTAITSDIILEDLISEISLSESAAISEEDLEGLVSKISKYTPGIKEDPKKITNRLAFKDQIIMTDGQYVTKPSVLATSTNGDSAQAEQESQSSKSKQITSYQVQGGDTLSLIAKKFGISIATIKAANNLSSDAIKPGQKLTILPTDGIVHVVKKGETLSGIVAYYKGNLHKTIQGNSLGQADRIFAGQKIVIIDGQKPVPTRVASSAKSLGQVSGIKVNTGRGPNHFPFGWCTWYVASRRYVPWRGNASAWSYQARRYGYQVGRTPAVGAIMVTHESRWGHVAYVEAVHGGTVTISEMNFNRWGRVNWRTLSASYGVYIY